MERLLVVGSGMTAASLSYLISRGNFSHLKTVLWDKSGGIGGRMSTHRSNEIDGCRADLGAQYFSLTPEYADAHRELFDLLLNEKVLEPLTATIDNEPEYPKGTKHFIASNGSSSIPKALIARSGADVFHNRHVSDINLSDDSKTWRVKCQDGTEEKVEALVLTMPVPQILGLKGDFSQFIDKETLTNLQKVEYSSRFALGLFFKQGTELPGDWTAKYISQNPCLRFISKDHKKRGRGNEPPSITVHTSVPFGLKMEKFDRMDVKNTIMGEIQKMFPDLPSPSDSKLIYWRFSQIHKQFISRPGCLLLNSTPPLILAGDAFTHSNINGAFASANAVVETLRVQADRGSKI